MNDNNLVDSYAKASQPVYPKTLSQRVFFSLLKKMKYGRISVTDVRGEKFEFGNKSEVLHTSIVVKNVSAYRKLVFGGSIGGAQAYVEGMWTCSDLVSLVQIVSRNLDRLQALEDSLGWVSMIGNVFSHKKNRNSKKGSRTNIAAHYDLSNDLYEMILDKNMQYSSAVFPSANATLEQAQEHKMELLCQRLELSNNDHLLEVGTGWGGLACYAAKNYGCRVTTTTISQAQYEIAQRRIKEQGLEGLVTLLLSDYRELEGQYDKIVSVEMIEAVGKEYMPVYFKMLDNLLVPGGKLVIQAITIEDQRYEQYSRRVDFIQKYIFPGGHLPSAGVILKHMKVNTSLRLHQYSDYGQHYAETLKMWRQNFQDKKNDILSLGFNEDFYRLWDYYFCYCEGAFRESAIGLAHIEMIKRSNEK